MKLNLALYSKGESGDLNAIQSVRPVLITFSLNTFIKICLLDTGGRISEIQKRLVRKGGYDFYKPLQQAVRAHSHGDHAKAMDLLDKPQSEVEKKHNQDAFAEFEKRFGSMTTLEAIDQSATVRFADAGIAIKLDPLFGFLKSGSQNVYALWPTKQPGLSQRYGAVACHLLRRAYADSALGNRSFFFADLVESKTYSEKQITNNTNLILTTDITVSYTHLTLPTTPYV